MNMSMDAWGGGLIVVFAVLLWIAYFASYGFKQKRSAASDEIPIDIKTIKSEMKALRLQEKEAHKEFVKQRAEFKKTQAVHSLRLRKFLFQRMVFVLVLLSAIAGGLGVVLGSRPLFIAGLSVFSTSALLTLRMMYVAARGRQKPEHKSESTESHRLNHQTIENPFYKKTWHPLNLPKPIYLADENASGAVGNTEKHKRIALIKEQMKSEFDRRHLLTNRGQNNSPHSDYDPENPTLADVNLNNLEPRGYGRQSFTQGDRAQKNLNLPSADDLEKLVKSAGNQSKLDAHNAFKGRCAST